MLEGLASGILNIGEALGGSDGGGKGGEESVLRQAQKGILKEMRPCSEASWTGRIQK